jgi:hypothetical protein
MRKNLTLAAVTAVAIAASSIAMTTGAFAAAPVTPHYKPLMCIFFPSMDVCNPPKPVIPPHHHHHMMKKPMKPMKPK